MKQPPHQENNPKSQRRFAPLTGAAFPTDDKPKSIKYRMAAVYNGVYPVMPGLARMKKKDMAAALQSIWTLLDEMGVQRRNETSPQSFLTIYGRIYGAIRRGGLDSQNAPHQATASAKLNQHVSCPFCGGDAESDTMQAFRRMKDGKMSNAVAIYCTKCTAQMTMCHEDFPEYAPEDMLTIMTEAWNHRAANAPDQATAREERR